METLLTLILMPAAVLVGIYIALWLIWQGIKAVGRKILNWFLGPEDITP